MWVYMRTKKAIPVWAALNRHDWWHDSVLVTIHFVTFLRGIRSSQFSAKQTHGLFFYLKPAGTASKRYLWVLAAPSLTIKWGFELASGLETMQTEWKQELTVIRSHIFIRRQRWTAWYMEKSWDWYLPSIKVKLSFLKAVQWFWHKHTHIITQAVRATSAPLPNWCLAACSQTHNVNTYGCLVFSGGHSWPLFLLHFLSFVYYHSIFPACAHPSPFLN